ncbi:MAG: type II pantothenate kinase [Muribaculaceae bacterium]|nr:type II pantothenate kinase [Muribaculaceae bacterium]
MSIIIGIDAGISSTKIIGLENGKCIMAPMSIAASDATSPICEVLNQYLLENNLSLGEVEHVMLTGVGASNVKEHLHLRNVTIVDEFKANGLGARFDSGLDQFIVVSMGTGTSLVRVDGDEISHIGGIGMGGGTLLGLSKLLLHTSDIHELIKLASDGKPEAVNLRIMDICNEQIEGLFGEATASLFAKATQGNPSKNDIAAGLIYMVLETIGSAAVLSQLNSGFKDFMLIGKLSELPLRKQVFDEIERLYDVHFHTHKYAPYCTALGAALNFKH